MQIIGLCRFSYAGRGGFQVMHETLEEREAYLYAPKRMDERFRHFETLTLPSIKAQSDKGFILLIVIGESFPEAYLERLLDLTEPVEQIAIVAEPPGRHRPVMRNVINRFRQDDGAPCLQFRLDDDDAVGIDFIERLRTAGKDLKRWARHHPQVGIDFNKGYLVRAGADGLHVRPTQSPYDSAGLAILFQGHNEKCVTDFGHHKVWREMPTVTFPDVDMMVSSYSSFNDSKQKRGGQHGELSPITSEQVSYFRAVFNIDNDHVRRVFSAPGLLPLAVEGEEA